MTLRRHLTYSWDRLATKLLLLVAAVDAFASPGPVLVLSTPGEAGRWLWCAMLAAGALAGLAGLVSRSLPLQRVGLPLCAMPILGYGLGLVVLSETTHPTGHTPGILMLALSASLLGRWHQIGIRRTRSRRDDSSAV